MISPEVHRSCRIKRRFAGIVLLCFCAGWFVPVGYGQAGRVSRLIAALKGRDANVRQRAAEALGEIKDPRAVEPLIAALKDADMYVRRLAAEALGKIKDPRAVHVLLAGLRERDLAVIAGAYGVFIERAEPGSEDVLIQALNAHGSEEMAEVYLNCGNLALGGAAHKWAHKRRYEVETRDSLGWGPVGVRWGSGR